MVTDVSVATCLAWFIAGFFAGLGWAFAHWLVSKIAR